VGQLETLRSAAPRRRPVAAATVVSGETRSKKSSYALGPGSPRPAASQSCSAPYHLSYPPFALRAGPHRHVASHGDERAEMAGPRAQAGGPTRWVRHRGNLPGPLHAAALHPRLVANPVPGIVLVSAASMRLPELRMRPSYSASSRRRRSTEKMAPEFLTSRRPHASSGRDGRQTIRPEGIPRVQSGI